MSAPPSPTRTAQLHVWCQGHWPDYELTDSGNGDKLERMGRYVLQRPEPQALWQPTDAGAWKKAHARFQQLGSHQGTWHLSPGPPMPESWQVRYPLSLLGKSMHLRLARTAFKHVGLFPEQALNWEWLTAQCLRVPQARVLNLFAYTGGASVACALAGAQVTHVDAVRQVIAWGQENATLNGVTSIRWIQEDALKFVQREVRRGARYHGILLDPPSFGHGAKGERWRLEEGLPALLAELAQLFSPQPGGFFLLNSYSMGLSALILGNLVKQAFSLSTGTEPELGELALSEAQGRLLPTGVVARFSI